jgi:transposase
MGDGGENGPPRARRSRRRLWATLPGGVPGGAFQARSLRGLDGGSVAALRRAAAWARRWLRPSMAMISARWSRRSRIAPAAGRSPSNCAHCSTGRLEVIIVERNSLRRSMAKLPVVEERLVPLEVQARPEAYVKIREERAERLECIPAVYRRRVLVREIYKRRGAPEAAPLTPVMPKAILEGSVLSASLLADILHKKYCLHQPFYRQEREFKTAHGLEITRNMLCHWHAAAADLLEPLYKLHLKRMRACRYLQGDEWSGAT